MPNLRIGTCSWKFPSWAGIVYSAAEGIDFLAEYAGRYDTVEVDQWFWSLFAGEPRLPNPADVEAYRRAVPDGFRFTVKAPNALTLTHHYAKAKGDPLIANPHFLSPELFARFLATLEPMGEKLGPIILQFGYLNRQHLNGQGELLQRLAEFLDAIPPGRQCAVEIRNPRWLNREHFGFIAEHGLVPVLLQGYWMPAVWEVHQEHRDLLRRCRTVVLRLHGPDREGMEEQAGKRWDRLVVQRDDELRQIAAMVQELLDAGVEVYLNANNHYEGCAPLTIERVRAMLGLGPSGADTDDPGHAGDLTLPGLG